MMKVSNGKTIRRLGWRSMKAARTRNLIAVLAIALTTVLFTSLFTIAMSINDGFQQSNFRQVGGFSHGGFKYLTEEQFNNLKDDPLIDQWGMRRFIGMPTEVPFNKSHVEVSYADANEAHWMYCDPVEGRLPQEGTDEAATDTHVLELLGVEPEIGARFTISFDVDGHTTTQTFTLCGWWEYDEAIVANHILIPESRADAILDEVGTVPPGEDGMTGSWNLDVMLKSGSRHIANDIAQILENHGYQDQSAGAPDYIHTGVNWGYTGAQLSDNLDPSVVIAVAAMLLLIIFTGYLIIYNVFQISVTNDIRFYGLLKTIGTTPRQLRRIIRQQALTLSLAGIPLGLVLGWLIGGQLTPAIVSQLNGVVPMTSVSPVIFIGAALFSLVTVLLSCRKPGRIAGKVSPIEAVRYTEGGGIKRKTKKGRRGVSLLSMAWANLGRSRGKTAVTVTSLSLAVVLLTVTVNFTNGFDMDKYVSHFASSDFIVADAGQFQTGGDIFNTDMGIPQSVIDEIYAQGGITDGGVIYGRTSIVQEFVTEEYYREVAKGLLELPAVLEEVLKLGPRIEDLSKIFTYAHNFIYLGRGYNYPTAMEGALKLKEISYIHAEGYPAAEMKHGPIALIDNEMPTVAIATPDNTYEKTASNIEEIRARGGKIIAVIARDDTHVRRSADYTIEVPVITDCLMPVVVSVPLQLLAYYIAVNKGRNVDQPRNLAKSVTVE